MSIIERPCPGEAESPRTRLASERRKKSRFLVLAAILVFLGLAACSSAPYQEMSDARQALESAQQAVGDMPGPQAQVRRADVLLERARDHLSEREHGEARRLAEQAKTLAIGARERAEQGEP